MVAIISEWRPHRGRAPDRLDASDAHHAASRGRLLQRENPVRLPDGAADHGRPLSRRTRPRCPAVGGQWVDDDGAAPRRVDPLRRDRHPVRSPHESRLARAGARRRSPTLFALFGGAWGPLATSGVFLTIVKCLPSYWLVQAGKSALGGSGWPPRSMDRHRCLDGGSGETRLAARLPARHRPGVTGEASVG